MPNQDPPRNREAELLPDPFWAADLASLRGQDFALHWYRWQLGLTVLAALFGTFPAHRVNSINIIPLLSLTCFGAAGVTAWRLHRRAPQEQWYEGRSAAESVKALTWKYVVRAQPFEGEPDDEDAAKLYDALVREVPFTFKDDPRLPLGPESQINDEMRRRRAGTLSERRELYLAERVRSQRVWYESRANDCDQKVQVAGLLVALLFSAGMVIAALEATVWSSMHALGLISACAAASMAWSQLKQYRPLAASYRLAARELDRIDAELTRVPLTGPQAETDWSHRAKEAEDAISREHIVWRARSQHRV
ncbi:DUF4231 domain-containing protein [Streptacidiphilus sp. EB103A]|uniref:DUF4231 domain-containing protein n=1 Tax=Streptacidiphilus sp. EB103A TaxID=3156275 RepID=UPI003519D215